MCLKVLMTLSIRLVYTRKSFWIYANFSQKKGWFFATVCANSFTRIYPSYPWHFATLHTFDPRRPCLTRTFMACSCDTLWSQLTLSTFGDIAYCVQFLRIPFWRHWYHFPRTGQRQDSKLWQYASSHITTNSFIATRLAAHTSYWNQIKATKYVDLHRTKNLCFFCISEKIHLAQFRVS